MHVTALCGMLKCLTETFIIKKKKNAGVRIFNQNIRFSVLFENILFSLILGRQSVDMDQTSLNFRFLCGLREFQINENHELGKGFRLFTKREIFMI